MFSSEDPGPLLSRLRLAEVRHMRYSGSVGGVTFSQVSGQILSLRLLYEKN